MLGVTGAAGVTSAEATDHGLHPAPFNARTVKVYAVPLLKPDTSHKVTDTRHDPPAGDEATWYVDTGNEPLNVGTDHDTDTDPSPATPITSNGADGGKTGGGGGGGGAHVHPCAAAYHCRTGNPELYAAQLTQVVPAGAVSEMDQPALA